MQIDEKSPFYEDLKQIEEQTSYMRDVILNISGFARQAEFKKEPIDINEPIEKSLQLLSEQLRLHGIKLIKNLDSNLPKVNGDANQMQQVFINFITNAREAMDDLPKEAKRELTIITRPNPDKERVEIIFKDTGSGIPDDIKDKIFDAFFTTKGPQSTGLGLSLNYGMVQEHGGDIEVETKVGQGTTFIVRLPAVKKV
jgi:signal transduction histidine kinase